MWMFSGEAHYQTTRMAIFFTDFIIFTMFLKYKYIRGTISKAPIAAFAMDAFSIGEWCDMVKPMHQCWNNLRFLKSNLYGEHEHSQQTGKKVNTVVIRWKFSNFKNPSEKFVHTNVKKLDMICTCFYNLKKRAHAN